MRGCLAAAVLLVSAAAAPACRRTAAEMVAALDLRPLSHSPCASAVIHADERYVLKHVLTRRDSLLERETCVLQKLQRFDWACLLYTSPSPRDQRGSRMPSSA